MVDADTLPRGSRARRETAARWLVVALILALPAAYLPRLASRPSSGGLDAPRIAETGPRNTDLVVVTTATWPAADVAGTPAFAELARRGARIDDCTSPSRSVAGAAASLWTGRYPAGHGVRSNALALAPGTWTLARAERDSGAATAAFLEEPLCRATGIDGFELVVEEPAGAAEALAERAARFLESPRPAGTRRVCLWVHLAAPGPRGERLAAVVARLRASRAGDPRRHLTLFVVAGLARAGARGALGDGAARAPLWVALPSGLSAGYAGEGSVSLVDLAGALCDVLSLPGPGPDEPPLQSHADNLWRNVNGSGGHEWTFLEGEHGDVLRFGRTRVAPDAAGALVASELPRPVADGPLARPPERVAREMRDLYRRLHAEVRSGGTEAVAASPEEPWLDW